MTLLLLYSCDGVQKPLKCAPPLNSTVRLRSAVLSMTDYNLFASFCRRAVRLSNCLYCSTDYKRIQPSKCRIVKNRAKNPPFTPVKSAKKSAIYMAKNPRHPVPCRLYTANRIIKTDAPPLKKNHANLSAPLPPPPPIESPPPRTDNNSKHDGEPPTPVKYMEMSEYLERYGDEDTTHHEFLFSFHEFFYATTYATIYATYATIYATTLLHMQQSYATI